MNNLDIGTLAGILQAQQRLDNLIPVIASRFGLLQEVQRRVASLSKEECSDLMETLIALQSHCRYISCVTIPVDKS